MTTFWEKLAIGTAAMAAAAICVAKSPGLPVVENVDLARYMGDWYEISHIPNFPQKDCTDTIVHYRLRDDGGFDLLNTCWKNGKYKPYSGRATRVDPKSAAKFRVKFFVFFGGDYWIVDLDPEYRWAVVGNPARDQLWVISREQTLDAKIYDALLIRARALGFDTQKLVKTIVTGKASQGFATSPRIIRPV